LNFNNQSKTKKKQELSESIEIYQFRKHYEQ